MFQYHISGCSDQRENPPDPGGTAQCSLLISVVLISPCRQNVITVKDKIGCCVTLT